MLISEIVDDIQTQMSPFPLIITESVITLNVKRAIRKMNGVSPTVYFEQVDAEETVALSSSVIDVINVYHNGTFPEEYPGRDISSTILGYKLIQTDSVSELAAMNQYMQDMTSLLGDSFTWKFVAPTLYVDDIPDDATTLFIQEYRRIDESGSPETDIPHSKADWIYEYALALCKIDEGRMLSQAKETDVDFDGDSLRQEGMSDRDALDRELESKYKVILWGGKS